MHGQTYNPIIVYKGRVTRIPVDLKVDVSLDVFTSDIRVEAKASSEKIASWDIEFETDGVDGRLILTLDDTTNTITHSSGYMDIKRMSGSEALPTFNKPLEVIFRDSVTP